MHSSGTCPECGKALAASGLEGLCPECMMKVGLAVQTGEAGPGATAVDNPEKKLPPPLSEVARLFPQLEILESLGCGGMGAVYKARQPRLDRLVALKFLAPPGDEKNDPRFAERFEREARALARLNHPNIIAVHEFGEAGGLPYLIMEYVDGLNLRQLERAGRLSPPEALKLVPQICEALQFAHEAGIVHRDIKPENILLDKAGRVKIADFGIAKMLRGENRTALLTEGQQVIGTPHYMAPEQVERPQTVDHRADIYSLGVVFYEMLTGELPLGKFAPPSRMVQVDVRLDEVVMRALEKQPERRYQHASEVKADIETLVTGASAKPSLRPRSIAQALAMLRIPALLVGAACFGTLVALTGIIENDILLTLGVLGAASCLLGAWRYWKWPATIPAGGTYDASQGPFRSARFWTGAGAIASIAILVWLAAPKYPSYTITGTVTDWSTGQPIGSASVETRRETDVVRQCKTDSRGRYKLVVPQNANLLYISRNGTRTRVELSFVASAPGYESSSVGQSGTRHEGYYRHKADFRLRPAGASGTAGAEDVASVNATESLAGGDPNKRFLLLGPKPGNVPPTNGCALLLVLPGGDGGPDFLTFIKRLYQRAVPENYLVADLIAPRWDAQQAEQIVWPTEMLPYPAMKFSTEAFIHSVISEIEKQHPLDTRRVFTLSWSSGGPAGYATSLYQKTRVTGSFIAMSVFHPPPLPLLERARNHAYFLLHSPEDSLIPIAAANCARASLADHGAQATLVTYPGGHGWSGNVFGNVNGGILWLEEHARIPAIPGKETVK